MGSPASSHHDNEKVLDAADDAFDAVQDRTLM
jgi:hypothetical protein